SPELRGDFERRIRDDYDRVRAQHAAQSQRLISLEQARQRAPRLNYDCLPQPEFTGVRILATGSQSPPAAHRPPLTHPASPFALSDLIPFIDWSPFFHTWELRGRYPAILNHERHGEEARKLFADAQKLLDEI